MLRHLLLNKYSVNEYSLDSRFGSLVQRLRNFEDNDPSLSIVSAKNSSPTVKIVTPDKKEKYLHSAYNPESEGEALAKKVYDDTCDFFVVAGFGFGYHGVALYRMLHKTQKMLILEPNCALFKKALTAVDFSLLINDERVFFIVEENLLCMQQRARAYLNDLFPYESRTMKMGFLDFYARWDTYHDLLKSVMDEIHDATHQLQEMRAALYQQMNCLRVDERARTFLGNFNECVAFYRDRIKNNIPLEKEDIGLLATYFLFSYSSYAETFDNGSIIQ